MKLLYILIFSFVIINTNQPTDEITIHHSNFITTFSKSKNYPTKVEWWVTKTKIKCDKPLKRENSFKPDPKLDWDTKFNDDYLNSGYDRGHMCPAADNLCTNKTFLDETFYFTNISPQHHNLNSGDWLKLEDYTRNLSVKYDSIRVFSGNIGEIGKIKTVSVPEYCWKVIYIKKTKTWEAYLFKNTKDKSDGIENNRVEIKKIETLTNYKFSK